MAILYDCQKKCLYIEFWKAFLGHHYHQNTALAKLQIQQPRLSKYSITYRDKSSEYTQSIFNSQATDS